MNQRKQQRTNRAWLTIDGLEIEVRFKRMKTVRIHIVPPDGRVWISAPAHVTLPAVETIARERLGFIHDRRARMAKRADSMPAGPLERGWHRLLGERIPIAVEAGASSTVRLEHGRLIVPEMIASDPAKLQASLDDIQRQLLHRTLGETMPVWEARIGRRASWWGIRNMRTRWGSCSPRSGRIRFSLNLGAHHPRQIEYVVLHELAHLIVPNHGPDFVALMDRHMPDWRVRKRTLNDHGEPEQSACMS